MRYFPQLCSQLWTFHFYVATFQQRLHNDYLSSDCYLYDITGLVFSYHKSLDRRLLLKRKLINHDFIMLNLKSSLRKIYGHHTSWFTVIEYPFHKGATCGAGSVCPSGAPEITLSIFWCSCCWVFSFLCCFLCTIFCLFVFIAMTLSVYFRFVSLAIHLLSLLLFNVVTTIPFAVHNCDLSNKIIYWVCNNVSNTTYATCGAGSVYPPGAPETTPSFWWDSCC